MSYYRFSWNPKRWHWSDLPKAVHDVNNNKPYDFSWSCRGLRRLRHGDTVFMTRLVVKPKGILGVASVIGEPFEELHWDSKRALAGDKVLRVNLAFSGLDSSPVVSFDELRSLFPGIAWGSESGCILIDDSSGAKLVELLSSRGLTGHTPPEDDQKLAIYFEGNRREVTTATYARNAKARQECLDHHGYSCVICDFNFGTFYGQIGEEFIEVHHLRPVSGKGGEYQVDPTRDLRPVCANCHRMLHKRREPLSIEELQALMRHTKAAAN